MENMERWVVPVGALGIGKTHGMDLFDFNTHAKTLVQEVAGDCRWLSSTTRRGLARDTFRAPICRREWGAWQRC